MTTAQEKKALGKFFTITNPFEYDAFAKWKKKVLSEIEKFDRILEPFAGANKIPELLKSNRGLESVEWQGAAGAEEMVAG